MYHGGFGGGHLGGGRLRSALDAGDEDDILGKVYDSRVVRRLPKYLAWVKSPLALAAAGTLMRTLANVAMPYLVAVATDNFIKTGNFGGLTIVALVYLGAALLMWGGHTWKP